MTRNVERIVAAILLWLLASAAAAETLKIGTLKFGTVNWLIDTVLAEKLDAKYGFSIERTELASNQALTISLQGGEAELIVSDWPYAMRRRAEGEALLFAPYSGALGALMASKESGLKGVADLKGRRLGVAGGPLDKSWLLLRAYAREAAGGDLAQLAEPVYAAPPLLSEQAKLGRIDAILTFWNFAARLDADGYARVVDMADVLPALGVTPSPPLVGFVWREAMMEKKGAAVAGFFKAVAKANAVLKTSDAAWERLRPDMRAASQAEFERLRDYFRAGIPKPWSDAETRAAEKLFGLLKDLGGDDLIGPRTRFDAALFWSPAP